MGNRAMHLLIVGGALLASLPALAQEGVLFQNLMKGVFGNSERDQIEYRQRPALVVPPSSQLPRPQDPASARSAAWPNDPDVARRRAEAEGRLAPDTDNEKFRNNPLLSQQDLRRGRSDRNAGAPVVFDDHNNYNNQIQPIRIGREQATRFNQQAVDSLRYGEEPPRRLLSEPPVGYRRPAGSAPVGPGQGGPQEDRQAVGQREFLTGTVPLQ